MRPIKSFLLLVAAFSFFSATAVGLRAEEGDPAALLSDIEAALDKGTVLRMNLNDATGKPVDVFINGRVVETVSVDLNAGPRPSEIS